MNRSRIEYLDYNWTVITGCSQPDSVCAVRGKCWARAMHKRFGKRWGLDLYNADFSPKVNIDQLMVRFPSRPARIGVGFTGDIGSVTPQLTPCSDNRLRDVLFSCMGNDANITGHQFFFLTKSPEQLIPWGQWPDNAWVGASVTSDTRFANIIFPALQKVQAKHKWLSFEPLLEWSGLTSTELWGRLKNSNIDWVVIGALAHGQPQPKREWVKEIVEACDQAGVKVWLKNNLQQILLDEDWAWVKHDDGYDLRQEVP